MKFKMIALAAIFTSASFAETESFNMTVSGDVIKDYCTIDAPLTSFDFGTIDTSMSGAYVHTEATALLGENAYVLPDAPIMSITCAEDTSFDLYPDIPTNGVALGDATVFGFDLYAGYTADRLVSQSNPLALTGDGTSQDIEVQIWIASTTGDLNDLEDSINTTVPWVLQTN